MSDTTLLLTEEIDLLLKGRSELTREEVGALWSVLFVREAADEDLLDDLEEGRLAFLDAIGADAEHRPELLAFRKGGWVVKVMAPGARGLIAGAVVGGLLVSLGAASIPAALVAGVVPMLFDIDRVELSKSEEHVLARLRLSPGVRDRLLTADELYDSLPADVRADLNRLDFVDLVDKCHRAGELKYWPGSKSYSLEDGTALRITFE